MVFQLEVYYKVDRLLTAQQKGTTARWYSNKTSLLWFGNWLGGLEIYKFFFFLPERDSELRNKILLNQPGYYLSILSLEEAWNNK